MAIACIPEIALLDPQRLQRFLAMPAFIRRGGRPAHPLAQSAAWGYLLDPVSADWHVPVFGTRGQTLTKVAPKTYNNLGGRGIGASTRATLDTWNSLYTSDGNGTGDFSSLMVASPFPSTTLNILAHQRENGGYYNSWLWRVNSYYTQGGSSGTTSAGVIQCTGFDTTAYSRGVYAFNRANGLPHAWLAVRRSGAWELYEDGLLLTSMSPGATADIAMPDYDPSEFSLCGWTTSDSYPLTAPLHMTAAWEYALTPYEAASLSADPWQLFNAP